MCQCTQPSRSHGAFSWTARCSPNMKPTCEITWRRNKAHDRYTFGPMNGVCTTTTGATMCYRRKPAAHLAPRHPSSASDYAQSRRRDLDFLSTRECHAYRLQLFGHPSEQPNTADWFVPRRNSTQRSSAKLQTIHGVHIKPAQ